jgi:hypothetical protein
MAWEVVKPVRYYKVELVVSTDEWNQQDLIDVCWYTFTGHDNLTLVQNIVYSVDGAQYEEEEDA